MKVRWTPEALDDRLQIWEQIAAVNSQAAAGLDHRFLNAVVKLEAHPEIGRPGSIPGTRELIPHENYRLVYEISGGCVWILTVVHTARRWPPLAR